MELGDTLVRSDEESYLMLEMRLVSTGSVKTCDPPPLSSSKRRGVDNELLFRSYTVITDADGLGELF